MLGISYGLRVASCRWKSPFLSGEDWWEETNIEVSEDSDIERRTSNFEWEKWDG